MSVDAQWKFPSLVDYYDFNKECLARHASRLSLHSDRNRDIALSTIRQTVTAMAAALDDDWLSRIAVSLADDLCEKRVTLQGQPQIN